MPYAQQHYPFVPEKKKQFEDGFQLISSLKVSTRPADGFTLMVLSQLIFNKPAFKNLIVNGLVLAADGKDEQTPQELSATHECGR